MQAFGGLGNDVAGGLLPPAQPMILCYLASRIRTIPSSGETLSTPGTTAKRYITA
jgi:hypothetical protein